MITLKEIEEVINKNLFRVNIQNKYVRSVEEIKYFGTYTSGDSNIDSSIQSENRLIMIPISTMLEYNKSGIPISIVNKKDTDIIYRIMVAYSQIYSNSVRYDPNISRLNEEDIFNIDDFVNKIFRHAKHYSYSSDTNKVGMYGSRSFFKEKKDIDEPNPTHTPFNSTLDKPQETEPSDNYFRGFRGVKWR